MLRGGGSRRFRFSRFLAYKLRSAFISGPNYPCDGLKWPWEWFLTIYENQNFLTFFVLGEFPKLEKIFFSKTGLFKMFYRSQFSIFFDETRLKRKKNIFRTYVWSYFRRFWPRGVPRTPNTQKVWIFREKIRKSPLEVEIFTCRFIRMCEIYPSFF